MLFFLIISCDKGIKNEFQIMQNDALRFCNNTSINDRVSLTKLHKKANLSSLEQRRCVQLLGLMYKLSKIEDNRVIAARTSYKKDVQFTENIFNFKQKVKKLYSTYIDDFYV